MEYKIFAQEIIKMKDNDLQVRQHLVETGELFAGYNKEMEKVHMKNANRLEIILEQIGWITIEKVGEKARDAAVIIVQHAISLPNFQRKCLDYIKKAIDRSQEEKRNYAFLCDRILFNERKPQKFGTQYDWDKDGLMSPWQIEKPETVNILRKEFGLNTIEEETAAIRQGVIDNRQTPPTDYRTRQKEIFEWSKKTGWIK